MESQYVCYLIAINPRLFHRIILLIQPRYRITLVYVSFLQFYMWRVNLVNNLFRSFYIFLIFSLLAMIPFLQSFQKRNLVILFIECPVSDDGMDRFACPTADRMGRYHCIDDHVLCDGFIDCPMGEDEDRAHCMFYKTVSKIMFLIYASCRIFFSTRLTKYF